MRRRRHIVFRLIRTRDHIRPDPYAEQCRLGSGEKTDVMFVSIDIMLLSVRSLPRAAHRRTKKKLCFSTVV